MIVIRILKLKLSKILIKQQTNMLTKQRSRITHKRQKSQEFKKTQSQKSTMIEKSIYPFKLGYEFMMNKYLQNQQRKQSKFVIQTYVFNRHKFTTELRLQCSDRQCVQRYYKNPKAVLKLRTNTQNWQSYWLRSRLVTNYNVQKIFEDYKKYKLRGEKTKINSIFFLHKQKKMPIITPRTYYDASDMCLQTLISKIQKMVHFKEESYEKLLDKLSESEDKIKTNENRSSNCLRSTKKRNPKNGKPLILHNIINEYGIQKCKSPSKTNKKKKQKKCKRKSLQYTSPYKKSTSKSKGSRKSVRLGTQNSQYKYDENFKKVKRIESPYKFEKKKKNKPGKSDRLK